MRRRWGSCTHKTRRIRIHWATMLMPPSIVDYILVHELVHLIEPNHSSAFWQRVERVLPDTGAASSGCWSTGQRGQCSSVDAAGCGASAERRRLLQSACF